MHWRAVSHSKGFFGCSGVVVAVGAETESGRGCLSFEGVISLTDGGERSRRILILRKAGE